MTKPNWVVITFVTFCWFAVMAFGLSAMVAVFGAPGGPPVVSAGLALASGLACLTLILVGGTKR